MSKPLIHAQNSAKKMGGEPCDYIAIHNTMDSSKSFMADSRHRAILHTAFGVYLMEKMFGIDYSALQVLAKKHNWSEEEMKDILSWKKDCTNNGTSIQNSDGKLIEVRNVAEQHCLEDFSGKFIPTPLDWLGDIPFRNWMNNGSGEPPESFKAILATRKEKTKTAFLT